MCLFLHQCDALGNADWLLLLWSAVWLIWSLPEVGYEDRLFRQSSPEPALVVACRFCHDPRQTWPYKHCLSTGQCLVSGNCSLLQEYEENVSLTWFNACWIFQPVSLLHILLHICVLNITHDIEAGTVLQKPFCLGRPMGSRIVAV